MILQHPIIKRIYNSLPAPLQIFSRAVYFFISSLHTSNKIQEFIAVNQKYWSSNPESSDKAILVDVTSKNPKFTHQAAVTGKYIANHLSDISIIFIDDSYYERERMKLLKSYYPKGVINVKSRYFYILGIFRAAMSAIRYYSRIDDPRGILTIEYKKFKIGDIIYNNYLRKEHESTIEKKDRTLFKHLFRGLLYAEYYDKKIASTNTQHVILSHDFYYLKTGVLRRMAKKNNSLVHMVNNSGNKRTQVKRNEKEDQFGEHFFKPDENLFKKVFQEGREIATTHATEYLDQKSSTSHVQDLNSSVSYSKSIYESYPVDVPENRSVVAIMPHILSDAVHSGEQMLYSDYCVWLRETLKIIDEVDQVDWIIKPHPHRTLDRYGYTYTPQTEDLFEDIVSDSSSHIHLIDPRISSLRVAEEVSAVVTVRGTVGLEYSGLGIPAVVAGSGPYSGFGFTVEPTSKSEYEQTLREIDDLESLSTEQIDRAKVLIFIRFILTTVPSTIISEDIGGWESMTENQMWEIMKKKMKDIEDNTYDPFYESIKKYLQTEYRNAIDPEFWDDLFEENA